MAEIWSEGAFSLLLLAFALGMDSFSVALGMGMRPIRLRHIFTSGLMVGIFHMVMPAVGIVIGQLLSVNLDTMASLIGGLLLIALGSHAIFSSLVDKSLPTYTPVGAGVWLFAFSVSIDSFSAGLSLGIAGYAVVVTIIMFGIVSTMMTWGGFLLGRKAHGFLGVYSGILGGSILCSMGLHTIF
ncbi:manganese efflux pump [Thalassobacillus sp. CUG 92003]|uniref:manganese efflux pump MntP n=1 Tax=Thalassobacillus sp. CUG 92003 TaxID=2736641 RepID=UPI0015E688D0|nr:manganese efflux pump [Thalassobacillus sp. CUG 92003]